MAWTAPLTWVSQALTAALLNQQLRDNMNETAPAKATAAGRFIVTTGLNAIAERVPTSAFVATPESTTSTSYTDLTTAGPAVTVTAGASALVFVSCAMNNNTAGEYPIMSFAISGATTQSALDEWAISTYTPAANATYRLSKASFVGLTAGSNTFTAKYKVTAGTGSFSERRIIVIPL
jgi:hypothetical protein